MLYVSEEGTSTLAGTFPRSPDIHLLTRESCWPKPTWAELVVATAEAAQELGAVLAIIDTFAFWSSLAADAEKDAGNVQPLLDALGQITQSGCAVALDHHQRKAGGEDGDAIRGSNAIIGAVDAFAEIERIDEAPASQRRLVVTPRWTAPPVLVYVYDDLGHSVVGQVADRAQSGTVGWEQRLQEAIPAGGDGVTLDEIAGLVGADRRKWHTQLAEMLKGGQLTRTGAGNRYDPYRHLLAAVPSSRPEHMDGKDGSSAAVHPSSRPIRTEDEWRAANCGRPSDGTAENGNNGNSTIAERVKAIGAMTDPVAAERAWQELQREQAEVKP